METRLAMLLALTSLLLLSHFTLVMADDSSQDATTFKTGDNIEIIVDGLRVRTTHTQGSVLGVVSRGMQGKITSNPVVVGNHTWWKIDFNGISGWCVEGTKTDKYFKVVQSKQDACFKAGGNCEFWPCSGEQIKGYQCGFLKVCCKRANVVDKPQESSSGKFSINEEVTVSAEPALHVRKGAGYDQEKIIAVNYGVKGVITSDEAYNKDGHEWWKVKFTIKEGTVVEGWCAGEYLSGSDESKTDEQADVLLITSTRLNRGSNFEKALQEYRDVISSEGLSSEYVIIDSEESGEKYGYKSGFDLSNWKDVRDVIYRLRDKVKPKYVIILGGHEVIPMPYELDTEGDFMLPLKKGLSTLPYIGQYVEPEQSHNPYESSWDGRLYTDDFYGDGGNGVPEVVVARLPGPVGSTSSQTVVSLLEVAIEHHKNKDIGSNMIMIGAAGDLEWNTNQLSNMFFGSSCNDNPRCYYAPEYCFSSNTECNKNSEYPQIIGDRGNDFIVFQGHSGLAGFATYADTGESSGLLRGNFIYVIIDGQNVISSQPFKENHPIIFDLGCYSGDITTSPSDIKAIAYRITVGQSVDILGNSPHKILTELDNGAAATFVSTRRVYTIGNVNFKKVWEGIKSGKTIGESFLDMKKSSVPRYLKVDEPKEGGYPKDQFVARWIQLYGDPTLKVG